MNTAYLIQQFKENPQRIAALVRGLSNEEARLRPDPDAWSVLEVINHLYDEEIHDFRSHLAFILDQENKEWEVIDPQAWVTERQYNQRDLAESLKNFLAERAKSIAWLESLGDVDWEIAYVSEFGTMRAGDMFAAWVAHDGLHLRQLVELQRFLLERAVGNFDVSYAGEW